MRNLKKILALVLALVMVIGMMSIASAATPGTGFADDAEITKYDEAVQILEALGIYKGDGEGNFEYNEPITRAETAALIYRIVHDEKYVGIYADYNKFDDVASNAWYAGYVNYCANGEFIVGDGNGSFNPNDYVTGYQVLAIVLRLVGYDREGEFQGAGWEVRTARKAKELGITSTIVDGTLGANATRGMVAALIYRSIAQTSTVDWSLLTSYTANNETLAHEYFGLRGTEDAIVAGDKGFTADDYKAMVGNADAEAEVSYYGEPVSYWYTKNYTNLDGDTAKDTIVIRYNPVKSYSTAVSGAALYTLFAAYDTNKDKSVDDNFASSNFYVDGGNGTSVEMKYGNSAFVGGNGAATDVFVVEGDVYVVTKNTYVAEIVTAYNALTGYVNLNGTAVYDAYALTKGMAVGTKVLYNKYNDGQTDDITTYHKANSQVVTVGSTYDNGEINTSYFKAGSTKYNYNVNYHVIENYYPTVGSADDIMNGKVADGLSSALFGLGDKAEAFFDDFGNVILLDSIASFNAGGVGVVIGIDTLRVSLGKYVLELDMILADGSKKTVKAVTESVDGWDFREDAADYEAHTLAQNGAFMTQDIVDAETGYYVLVEKDGVYNYHTVVDVEGDVVRGDANAITNADIDSTTTFIVETYKNDGKEIKGYTTYKGFKNVPSLEELLDKCSLTVPYNPYTFNYVIFASGYTKGEQPATVNVDELVFVMDDVPEKNLTKDEDGNTVVYWTYTVVKNGQVTTVKSTTDPTQITEAGLYLIEKDTETRNFYTLEYVEEQRETLGAHAVVGVTYGDVVYGESTKLTLADSVKVYSIAGTTLTELTLADLKTGMDIEFLVDKYGYVTTIYVVADHGLSLDFHTAA